RYTEWLQHDAMLLAQDEEYDQAVESCQAILNAGRAFDGDPFLIAHLIRVALQTIAISSLERVLAQGEASDECLQAMQVLLEKESRESSWLPGLRGERGGTHHLFENIRNGKVKGSWLNMMVIGKGFPGGSREAIAGWFTDLFPASLLSDYPAFLRHMNRGVEIAKLPIHESGPKLKEWQE